MIITITGSNSFALRQRLEELEHKFVAEQGELALERVDGSEVDLRTIIDAVQSLPFLAERKMVVVREPSANKAIAEAIEQIISSSGKTTELIIYEPVIDRRTSYFKVLKSQTQMEEYADLDTYQLAKWLVDAAKKQAGELSLADANFLVERIGPNQQMLAMELEKLLTYDSKITRENIELLTVQTPQSKIFDLLDAAFAGNKKRALRLYEDQRAQKVEPQAILAMIAWQLNILALAKLGKGRSANEIAKDAGLSPYPVTKAFGLVNKMDDNKLKILVHEAFQMDWHSKTSGIDLDEALKTYIITL